ncbi:MAG TPA: fibronectin type III domain-containing protein [Candidatus Paceibacterota bacterium]|nr:fibronectin type III domain-containing protein [Candidatus Paceibacterota bacterium]
MKHITFFLALFFLICANAGATSVDPTVVELHVNGCNNNGICEPLNGETVAACPLDCTITTPTSSTSTPPENRRRTSSSGIPYYERIIDRIQATPGTSSISLVWETTPPSIGVLLWGKTPDFEAGAISESAFGYSHGLIIRDLLPDTTYYMQLVVRSIDGGGEASPVLQLRTNTTKVIVDIQPEISYVGILEEGGAITLEWGNPPADTFSYIRIVKKDGSFPKDAYDGRVVYEGRGETVTDRSGDGKEYYGIFVRGKDGKYSRGAFARIYKNPGDTTVIPALNEAFNGVDFSSMIFDARYDLARSICLNDFPKENRGVWTLNLLLFVIILLLLITLALLATLFRKTR